MARIRSIHPSLWTDENFVSLSAPARLFLIGLWGEADDYGIFEWKPVGLKMRLAPADAVDAAALLGECEAAGFIVQVERGGKPYGVVRNFRKFQRPKNPSSPIITVDLEIAGIISLPDVDKNYPSLPQGYPTSGEIHQQMEDVGCRMEEEDIPSPSEPGATAPPAAPTYTDARHELYGEGKPILLSLGVAEKQCGAMITRWLRDTGDDCAGILDAIRRARDERVMDPIPWITRALPTRNRHDRSDRHHANRRPTGASQFNAALADAVARRTVGRDTPGDPGSDGAERARTGSRDGELFAADGPSRCG